MKQITFAAMGALILSLAAIADDKPSIESLRTVRVTRGELALTVQTLGSLQPHEVVPITPQIGGQVTKIMVSLNAAVRQGDVLAEIDATAQQIAMNKARARLGAAEAGYSARQHELDGARRQVERARALAPTSAISADEVDQLTARAQIAMDQVKAAQAQLDVEKTAVEESQLNLSRTRVISPTDGIVLDARCVPGQTVAADAPAFVVARMEIMTIVAPVGETEVAQIHEGQTARFTVPAFPNRPFEGRVRHVRLAEAFKENGQVYYPVAIDVANERRELLPHFSAAVTIETGRVADAMLVPVAAMAYHPDAALVPAEYRNLRGSPDPPVVWVRHAGELSPIRVKVLHNDGKMIQVNPESLVPGDEVVIGGK